VPGHPQSLSEDKQETTTHSDYLGSVQVTLPDGYESTLADSSTRTLGGFQETGSSVILSTKLMHELRQRLLAAALLGLLLGYLL